MPADFNVVEYLASKGYRGRQASGPEVAYPCFFDCNEPQDSRKRKLYINTAEGFYNCKVCDVFGGTYLLQKFFGDDPKQERPEQGPDPLARRRILREAAEVGAQMLGNNDEALLYLLNERGLHPETIEDRKLGLVAGSWSLTSSLKTEWREEDLLGSGLLWKDGPRKGKDFFYDHILIPYQTRGAVSQMRGRAWKHDKPKYVTGQGDAVRIYNQDDLDGAEDVIITEGEFDCLIVRQILDSSPEEKVRRVAVVGISGTGALPDDFESYFAQAKRVFIGFDADEPGKKAAAKIKEKLGARARILEFPHKVRLRAEEIGLLQKEQDWTSLYVKASLDWQDVVYMMSTAKGKRVFSFAEAGVAFYTVSDERPPMKTGIVSLDAIIGGIKPGQVMIPLAKTGTGKTILCCNIAYYMRQYKVLVVSLELTREEVYNILRKIYLFHNPRADRETMEFALENVYINDENRMSEKSLGEVVDEFELESGVRPDVVIVDYLGYYSRGFKGGSPYEKSTNGVMKLKEEAKGGEHMDPRMRYAVISPSQVNRGANEGKPITLDDARDSGAIEETADFLFGVWRPDDALRDSQPEVDQGLVQQSNKTFIDVLKSRTGGKGKRAELIFDLLTLALVEDRTPEATRAQEHNRLYYQGWTWEMLRKQETAPEQRVLWRKND